LNSTENRLKYLIQLLKLIKYNIKWRQSQFTMIMVVDDNVSNQSEILCNLICQQKITFIKITRKDVL